jgi:hypothetical protein
LSRRRKDKFMQDMGRIQRDRQRRRTQREKERLLDEEAPLFPEKWQDLQDGLEFRSREFGALGKEVTRRVGREAGLVGKGILQEGVDLTVDFITCAATLGLVNPPSPIVGERHRRRRHR